jgi:multidrug efflux pump subunit AcrA (membrane-fusion protein)
MDIKRMQLGQSVSIRLEAFPGPVFHGSVSNLSPMAIPQPDAPEIRVFEIYIDIDEQDERLKPGMSTEAEIVLEHFTDTLFVPLSAIFNRGQKKIVYRLQNGNFAAIEVELGQRNTRFIVINSGLKEGDIIALEQL